MYTGHFHLAEEPFSLTPDPAYLYLSPEHREALAAIQYGLVAGRGFCTLIGEVGTGKTTLLYSLLSQLGSDVETAYIAYTTQSVEDLLAAALRDMHIDAGSRSKGALLEALNAHLVRRADEGRTVALIIDEAQDLSDAAFEELRLLSNFESYTRKLMQIVLVGQPELQDRLRQPQLRQLRERVGVRAVINPLSNEEMERYIEHRLQRAGGSTVRLFEPWAVKLIVRRAAGIPRRANILCHNALLFAYGRGLPQVTARVGREAIAEMDERRPGFAQRGALRRSQRPGRRWRWVMAAGVVGAIAAIAAAYQLGKVDSPPPAVPSAAPAPPAPEAAAPAAPPPPAAEQAPAPPPDAPPHARADAAPPVADAASPAPAKAEAAPPPEEPKALELTVPRGTTLTRLVRQLYGGRLPLEREQAVFAEVRRLNPQLKSVDLILAGDLLRLPAPRNP
ncbi:MAG TPA: AAA family ATPase [Candidatus Binatia bacterium]|nr:AAA family ATPase [Candidatus Binatia bacterium]